MQEEAKCLGWMSVVAVVKEGQENGDVLSSQCSIKQGKT